MLKIEKFTDVCMTGVIQTSVNFTIFNTHFLRGYEELRGDPTPYHFVYHFDRKCTVYL